LVTGDAGHSFGSGYWKHQYSGNGNPQLDEATLEGYLEIVNLVSGVFSEEVLLATEADAAAILSPHGGDKRAVATADLLTAWLHFASGAVPYDALVPVGGLVQRDYLEVMAEIESIVSDPTATRAELIYASFLAQRTMQAE
jgi:hypothetical protein